MFGILEGEDAEEVLEKAEMVLVDTVTNHKNESRGASSSNVIKDNTKVTIDADVVVICDDGLSDIISGVKELEE